MKRASDGTPHRIYERALAEARQPVGAGNKQATARTVELAQAMAEAALVVMRDPKRAVADKLTDLDGCNAVGNVSAGLHDATAGSHQTNDSVESKYGCYDYASRV